MYTRFFLLTGLHPSHNLLTLDLVFMPRICPSTPLFVCTQLCGVSAVAVVGTRLVELQGNVMDGRVEDKNETVRKDRNERTVFLDAKLIH